MKKSEMMRMLFEAHRQIGELEERNAQAQMELQRMRLEFIDPTKFQTLFDNTLTCTDSIVPVIKLARAITGQGLLDSKTMIDESALGKLIHENNRS